MVGGYGVRRWSCKVAQGRSEEEKSGTPALRLCEGPDGRGGSGRGRSGAGVLIGGVRSGSSSGTPQLRRPGEVAGVWVACGMWGGGAWWADKVWWCGPRGWCGARYECIRGSGRRQGSAWVAL